ncbi:MAG: DUF5654 family protein [Thermoplasmata archaeon]
MNEEEDKKLSIREVRMTISASLAAAFGFVIALVWKEVVMGGFAVMNINLTAGTDAVGWAYFTVTALIVTIIMIFLIILISRWGSKE